MYCFCFFIEVGKIYGAKCCLNGGSNQIVPEAGGAGGAGGETVPNRRSHIKANGWNKVWFQNIDVHFIH